MNYLNSLKNNLIITVTSVLFLIIFSSMSAYVIARSNKIVSSLKLINTHLCVILISVFCINLPLSIFLMRGFINTVPIELEEAALIDGCGTFECFWRIIFPLL